MMPGMPRFRLPDFSVSVSPVLPYISGMPCMTARGRKDRKSNMGFILLFAGMAERYAIIDKELTANNEEKNNTGKNIRE